MHKRAPLLQEQIIQETGIGVLPFSGIITSYSYGGLGLAITAFKRKEYSGVNFQIRNQWTIVLCSREVVIKHKCTIVLGVLV